MKKLVTAALVLCLVLSGVSPAFAATTTKEPQSKAAPKQEVFNKDKAIQKINNFTKAYIELTDVDIDEIIYLISAVEYLTLDLLPEELTTKDDYNVDNEIGFSVVPKYYYERVNNGKKYYSILEYVEKNNARDIAQFFPKGSLFIPTDELILVNAAMYGNYISTDSTIAFKEFKVEKDSKFKVAEHKVCYSLYFDVVKKEDKNNKGTFAALYDAKGNLLNILCVDDKNVDAYTSFYFED